VSVLTDGAIGGTFLTWTIEYIAGHKNVYSSRDNNVIPLLKNPVQGSNAHLFRVNQCYSFTEVKETLNAIDALDITKQQFNTLYTHPFAESINHDTWNSTVNLLTSRQDPVLIVRLPEEFILYHSLFIARGFKTMTTRDSAIDEFFSESYNKWNELNLTEIYDKREFMALNFRPFDFTQYSKLLGNNILSNNTFSLVAPDIWHNLDNTIYEIMNFINCELNVDRYNKWLNVYTEWKKIHEKRIMWCWYYEQIMDYIINGHDMDLARFDLDIYQEATIQHTLIYKHNLNLKTYKLNKFVNTKQLHNLLEPNIHTL